MTFDVKQLVGLRRVSAVAAAPDGTWLAVSVQRLNDDGSKYMADLWRVPLGSGEPSQLTRGASKDTAPCFRQDGALGFLSDRRVTEGQEVTRNQVWILPAVGGEPQPLTDEPLGVSEFKFAGDRLVALAAVLPGIKHEDQRKTADELKDKGPSVLRYTEGPVRFWDHWVPAERPHVVVYDCAGGGRRDLTPSADREYLDTTWSLSADGGRIAIIAETPLAADRIADRYIHVIDTETGDVTVVGDEPLVHNANPVLSADGSQLALNRMRRSVEAHGGEELRVYDLATGQYRALATDVDRWFFPAKWSADGDKLICPVDDRGDTAVYAVHARSGEVTRITSVHSGGSHTNLCLVPGSDRIAGLRSSILHPPEPFTVALAAQQTPELAAELSGFARADGDAVASVERITVAVEGSRDVQAFVVTPNDGKTGPRPTIMFIHGGPIHQWSDVWHWRWNSLVPVAQGYTVILPNPSGSTGFGQASVEGIWGNTWGGQCYRDLMTVADVVGARPDVDECNMVAMGGSFGGYMTNWIGGSTDRFKCLVTHASIFDMSAFHGVTDFPGWWVLEMGGTSPYAERDLFDTYSPRTGIANWKSPTLIIHGEKDYRCPIGEGLALFEGLRSHGVEAELLIFPDENHWILKPRNIAAWYDATLDFIERHTS